MVSGERWYDDVRISSESHVRAVLSVLVLPVATLACRAHMVSAPGGDSEYGPVNQASRGGVIKYKNSGLAANKRRENAYRQMYKACGGYYRIDAEGPRS